MDGDTLRVRLRGEERTVRLLGIDAPEKGHPSRPVEFLARESAGHLERLVAGRAVLLEPDREDADEYGRLLRYVFLLPPDGRLANLEMVRDGYARALTRFPFSRKAEFLRVEDRARLDGKGVWRDGGMAELRWLTENREGPAQVYRSGGGRHAVAYRGWGKAGLRGSELARAVETIARLRSELADKDFAREARRAGFRPISPEAAGAFPPDGASPLPPAPPGTTSADAISWEDAAAHVGREVAVEGTIVRAYRSRNALFLNFHPNWKKYLSVVVPAGELRAFPDAPEEFYRGKRIRVRGVVSLHEGRLRIVVRSPEAVTVLPGPRAP